MTRKGLCFLVILCLGMLIGVVLRNAIATVPPDHVERMTLVHGSAPGDLVSMPQDEHYSMFQITKNGLNVRKRRTSKAFSNNS